MQEMAGLLEQWRMDTAEVRRRMYRAPTPRERERWHAVWLLAQGWTAAAVGRALERDAHTIGQWVKAFARAVPRRWFSSKAVVPPRVGRGATRGVEGSGTGLAVGGGHQRVELDWKVVRQYVADHFGLTLSRSPPQADLNYLHRLGFVLKRPRKRLVKADPGRRATFVGEYATLTATAPRTGTKIFFADEAHFQADADLRGKWVLKGEPALVDSSSPRRGEKVSYYSVRRRRMLETGEVEVMELEGNPPQADHLCRLPAVRHWRTGATPRTADRDLGQFASPPRRRHPGLSDHTRPEPAPGELAQLQSGLQPRRGHLGLGTPGSYGQSLLGNPCCGAREGGRLFRRSDAS